MNKVNDFVDDFVKYMNIDTPEYKNTMFKFLNERGISVKGNYFNIKINTNMKPRGRPRKEFVFKNDSNPSPKSMKELKVEKDYKLLREISKDNYVDMLGKNYSSKELCEEVYI